MSGTKQREREREEFGVYRQRFDALFEAARPFLEAKALHLTRRPVEAEDLIQEVAYRAFRRFDTFVPEMDFKAWCLQIMKHRHVDLMRIQRPKTQPYRTEDGMEAVPATEGAEPGPVGAEYASLLQDILPPLVRQAFALYLEGWPYDRIARERACASSAVRAQIEEAVQILRNHPDIAESLRLPEALRCGPRRLTPLGIARQVGEYDLSVFESKTDEVSFLEMAEDARLLVTGRATARNILVPLGEAVRSLREGQVLLLRFDSVRMTADVAEEVVQHLYASPGQGGPLVKGKHLRLGEPG